MRRVSLNYIQDGGIADSKYRGLRNSVASIVGLDIHSEPGLIQANQKLKKDSGDTIDDLCLAIVQCSDGNTYFFGSNNGKIWKRTSSGVYTLEAQVDGGVVNAIEYEGYIYYFTQAKIGRWKIGDDWSSRVDSYKAFKNGNMSDHPAIVLNLVLYIGDGNLIAKIREYGRDSCDMEGPSSMRTSLNKPVEGMYFYDTTTNTIWTVTYGSWVNTGSQSYTLFVDNELDLQKEFIITALKDHNYQLLIGTRRNGISNCGVFLWDTWSVSYSVEDKNVPANGVKCWLDIDNSSVAVCGDKGELYQFNGSNMTKFSRLPGKWYIGNSAIVYNNAAVNLLGKALFGVSNIANNPIKQGIYSYASYSPSYNTVLNLEYVLEDLNNVKIGAITGYDDNIFVSWQDGNTYGISTIDKNNKYSGGYIESLVLAVDRDSVTKYGKVSVCYEQMPEGCDIEVYVSENRKAYRKIATKKDDLKQQIETEVGLSECSNVQYKIVFICSQNKTPIIDNIIIKYE